MPNTAKTSGKNAIKSRIDGLLHGESVKLLAWLTIDTDEKHRQALEMLEYLMLNTEDSPRSPYNLLIEFLGLAVAQYEAGRYQIPRVSPVDIIRSLMADHGLRQCDLPEIGNQAKVSEVLSGKRQLNKRQIAALCQRFNLSPTVFFREAG